MLLVEKFAQFRIFAEDTTNILSFEPEITIRLFNGSDEIGHEVYLNVRTKTDMLQAARDLMRRSQGAITYEDIEKSCRILKHNWNYNDIEADFTDYTGETTRFYFRRYADDCRYFKQFTKEPILWMEK